MWIGTHEGTLRETLFSSFERQAPCPCRGLLYDAVVEQTLTLISTFEPEIQSLILAALNKAVRCDGSSRLLGRPSGLFPGGNTKSRAVKYCLESAPPLLARGSVTPNKRALHVRPTQEGLSQLLTLTASEDRVALVEEASSVYRQLLLKSWAELASRQNWTEDLKGIETCCANLIQEIQSILPKDSGSAPTAANGDGNFKRDLAHELVISWKYAKTEEAREGIARALRASGVQQIGEVGDRVEFVGRRHVCNDALFPGDAVEVIAPGWVVHDGVGEYLLEKASVRAIE